MYHYIFSISILCINKEVKMNIHKYKIHTKTTYLFVIDRNYLKERPSNKEIEYFNFKPEAKIQKKNRQGNKYVFSS